DHRQVDVAENAAEQAVDVAHGAGHVLGRVGTEQAAHHRQAADDTTGTVGPGHAERAEGLAERAGQAADELGESHVDLQDTADRLGQERAGVAADVGLGATDVDVEL